MTAPQDDHLEDWSVVASKETWSGIVIGNGASRAVWPAFGYASLYQTASSKKLDHPLEDEDRAVFDALGTTNFEEVLAALATTNRVLEATSKGDPEILARYDSIKTALIEAVS